MKLDRAPVAVTLALVLSLSAALVARAATPHRSSHASALKVAMLFSEPINGSSWDTAAYNGLQAVKTRFHVQTAYTESVKLGDIAQVLRSYASHGYNLVFGNGFEYGQPMAQVAPQFPNVKFVAMTGITSGPNLESPQLAENQGGFLSGALAGLMTKSNKVGCVASQQLPFIVSQMEAYKLGAKYVNKKVKARVTYTGSFTDVAKAKQAAEALADTGVDVLCQDADNGGPAIISVARSRHLWSIGMSEDQNSLAPRTVLSSVVVDSSAVIQLITRQVLDGKFTGGKPYFGVKEHAIYLAPFHGLVPATIAQRLQRIATGIAAGTIKVPLITKPTTP
jgi:basic membrane protein A